MPLRLRLVCHGSTSAVRTGTFPADEPLDRIDLQKRSGADFGLRDAERCWTSPALRAMQTAEALGLPAIVEPLLRECDYGRWTGRSLDDVQAQEPEALGAWLSDPAAAPHGGESLAELLSRVLSWLETLRTMQGKTVAITHASVIRAAIVHALGAPPSSFWRIDVTPLSLTGLNGVGGRWTLASANRLPLKRRAPLQPAPSDQASATEDGVERPQR